MRGESQLVRVWVRRCAEEHQPVHNFIVQQIADRKMASEHVLAKDAAVAAEPDSFGVEDDFGVAAEVADHVAAPRVDLLEKETPIDVRTYDDGKVLDRRADKSLMNDRVNHMRILLGDRLSHPTTPVGAPSCRRR